MPTPFIPYYIVCHDTDDPSMKRLEKLTGARTIQGKDTNQLDAYAWDMVGFNYGYSGISAKYTAQGCLNPGFAVWRAVNKQATFEALLKLSPLHKALPTVPWTIYRQTAQDWYDAGETVFARALVAGNQGHGLVIARKASRPLPGHEMPNAKLYTMRPGKNLKEIRVFAWRTDSPRLLHKEPGFQASHMLIKRRMGATKLASIGITKPDPLNQSYDKGWIMCGMTEEEENTYRDMPFFAANVLARLGLDWGAVDVVVDSSQTMHNDPDVYDCGYKYAVLEVNTAPAIERADTTNWIRNMVQTADLARYS